MHVRNGNKPIVNVTFAKLVLAIHKFSVSLQKRSKWMACYWSLYRIICKYFNNLICRTKKKSFRLKGLIFSLRTFNRHYKVVEKVTKVSSAYKTLNLWFALWILLETISQPTQFLYCLITIRLYLPFICWY